MSTQPFKVSLVVSQVFHRHTTRCFYRHSTFYMHQNHAMHQNSPILVLREDLELHDVWKEYGTHGFVQNFFCLVFNHDFEYNHYFRSI